MAKKDAFISYAVEDRISFVEALAAALKKKGVSVYFFIDEIEPGGSISDAIYKGLDNSRYCICILSLNYHRHWPAIERQAILQRERRTGKKLLFPVRHMITEAEARQHFPELNDHFALDTSIGAEALAEKLAGEIEKRKRRERLRIAKRVLLTSAVLLLSCVLLWRFVPSEEVQVVPSREEINEVIEDRLSAYQQRLDILVEQQRHGNAHTLISVDSLEMIYESCNRRSIYSRNSYTFVNDWFEVSGHANVEQLGFSFADSPHEAYGIPAAQVYVLELSESDSSLLLRAAIVDSTGIGFLVDTLFQRENVWHAFVRYDHNVRLIMYKLDYAHNERMKRQEVRVYGFKPMEELILDNTTGHWELLEVR
jgi:hypothetical protein